MDETRARCNGLGVNKVLKLKEEVQDDSNMKDEFKVLEINEFLNTIDVIRQSSSRVCQKLFSSMR